jgi:hypothetical protein
MAVRPASNYASTKITRLMGLSITAHSSVRLIVERAHMEQHLFKVSSNALVGHRV